MADITLYTAYEDFHNELTGLCKLELISNEFYDLSII